MVVLSRVSMGLGAFLIVVSVVYGAMAGEYEGLVLIITVAGGALLVGGYLARTVTRTRLALSESGPAQPAADEPHVGPTIWPLVFALSTIGLVVGAVASRWALLGGGVLLVIACAGWLLDVHRQWRHHAAGSADPGGQQS